MELNMTNIVGASSGQAFDSAFSQIGIPVIIFISILAILVFALGGLFVAGGKSKARYYGIWALCSIIVVLVSIVLIYNPHFIFDKILGWFI